MTYIESVQARLKSRIIISPSGCWLWQGAISSSGYGEISYEGTPSLTHRVSWLVFNGAIPDGRIICHTCDIRSCINPEHLFAGTYKENQQDSIRKGRAADHTPPAIAFCQRGHEFTSDNTYWRPEGRRMCRTCMRLRKAVYNGQ